LTILLMRRSVRFLIGGAVIAMLVAMVDSEELRDQVSHLDGVYVAVAVGVQLIAKLIWTWRWQMLLRSVGLRRDFFELLQLIHVGLFVNWFLPSFVGGDVARSHLSKEGNPHAAYAVVVGERIVGFLTLLSIAVVGAAAAAAMGTKPGVFLPLAGILLMGLLLCCAAPLVARHRVVRLGLTSRSLGRVREHLDRFGVELRRTLDLEGRFLWIVGGLSYALHFLAIYFHLMCARSANVPVDFADLLIVVPISVFVAMLPVSVNGLGLREGALVGMLALFGVDVAQGAVFAVLTLAVSSLYSLVGGLILLFRRDLAFAR
jgi:glycosyltransferase 2 family protein